MKNILLESTKSKFKVLEHKPANVLKRIQGVLSDFKSNRNGRIYPRELWENVLNSDYVKEMIESHGLVGELDHPEERLEISLQNVSHVINDMWIEGDQVVGTIDILPTPSGKIVSELLDYGTDIGISSRGAGSVGPNNVVDPDYQFVTFDFVARPSCEAARLNMIVESVQPEIDTNSDDKVKNILEGYKTSLKEDNTTSSYIDIREIVRYAEEYLAALLNSSVGITKQQDGQYMITMKNDDKTIAKWLDLHNKYNLNEESDFETYTDYSGDKPVERQRHTMSYCNMAALDMVHDALSDELGPDWRKKSLSDIEDIVHETVFKYNEANVQPEYEDEDFYGDEADARAIYRYILDNEIPTENKTTETRPMNEAVMSDQEVYKTVLEWYKAQIEGGKMTLNQCYELLSDKAKVSLNKMVDQSKIRESMINKTINKLIKESIALNEGYDLEAIEYIVRDHLDEDYRAIENGVEMEDWYYDFVMNNTDEDIEAIVNILKDKEKITNNLIDEVIRDYVKGN